MTLPVFSDPWARACGDQLNRSAAYRAAAATWEGALLLRMTADGQAEERLVYLDLWHGECRLARAGGRGGRPLRPERHGEHLAAG